MREKFNWERIGDVELGRQNLGDEMPVEVYRLMQYTILDELITRYEKDTAEDIIRSAGFRAGKAFSENIIEQKSDFHAFVAELQQKLKAYKIGVLRIEHADLENLRLILTVSEDLDCSGLPVTGDSICVYDEGFISALLEDFTGKNFLVVETDCWATGDRTCRFTAECIN